MRFIALLFTSTFCFGFKNVSRSNESFSFDNFLAEQCGYTLSESSHKKTLENDEIIASEENTSLKKHWPIKKKPKNNKIKSAHSNEDIADTNIEYLDDDHRRDEICFI